MFKELIYILPLLLRVTQRCVAIFHLKEGWQNKPWSLRVNSKSEEMTDGMVENFSAPQTLAASCFRYVQNGIWKAWHTSM